MAQEKVTIKFWVLCLYFASFLVGSFFALWAFDEIIMPFVVGSGKAYEVPNLTGLPVETARSVAVSDGFDILIVKSEYQPVTPPGRVISQIPQGGSLAKKGRKIRVVVSGEPAKVAVPQILGEHIRNAQFRVEQAGLSVASIETTDCDSLEPDFVYSTLPMPGESVTVGSQITIVVCGVSEKTLITTPNVVGMNYIEAMRAIELVHLTPVISWRRIPTIGQGAVFRQDPPAGTRLHPWNKVVLLVNKPDTLE